MTLILGVLGALSLLLSGLLVVNTVSSLLTSQVRQVGIMKAVGARADQIVGMYLAAVAGYGLLALIVAVPLGVVGARAFAGFTASLLNFEIGGYNLPPRIFALEIAAGLVVPLVFARHSQGPSHRAKGGQRLRQGGPRAAGVLTG
jgi:putative ABC transport system permease protein